MKRIFLVISLCMTALAASAQAPLIGIVTGHSESGSNSVGDSYIQAVVRSGGVPVLIPTMFDKKAAEAVVERVDAILFTGGEDVNPAWYGEEINGATGINDLRDTSEIHMVRKAAELGIPMLGICRGCQVINVALGGSLVQDIPSQVNTTLMHKQKEPSSVTTQTMSIEPDSHIAKVLGVTTARINSHHHESVKLPAKGIRIVARADDGVVECYEGMPGLDVVAVQFHPEKLIQGGDDFFLPIFKDLVQRAINHRK